MNRQPVQNFTRVAMAIIIAAVMLSATILLAASMETSTKTSSTSSVSACSLLTPAEMDDMAWNGAGREIPGLNQSAPPWDYQSIYGHIEQGWESICQSTPFVTAIQAHGTGSFSPGGGFVNPSNPNNSRAAIALIWSNTLSANCTQYIEEWDILIVNGTVAGPSTSTTDCINIGGAASSFEVLETNVTVSYPSECLVLENIGHTCPTVSRGGTGSSASPMRGVELVAFQAADYYAGNFSAGFTGPYVSHNIWFTNSTIFCVSPLLGDYPECPVNEPLPSVSW